MKSLLVAATLLSLASRGSAEPIALPGIGDYSGQVVMVTLFSQFTRFEAERVNDALERRARPGVALVSVFDLMGIPSTLYDLVRYRVAKSIQGRRLHILLDDSSKSRSVAAAEPFSRIDILILDRAGSLAGHFIGEKRLPEALALVDRLTAPTTAAR